MSRGKKLEVQLFGGTIAPSCPSLDLPITPQGRLLWRSANGETCLWQASIVGKTTSNKNMIYLADLKSLAS